jgi:hypothetical protein
MVKLVSVYQRGGSLFIAASHRTLAGFWVTDEHVSVLANPNADETADAVIAALDHSKDGVATPASSANLDRPLLAAAGVSSRKAFAEGSTLAVVRSSAEGLKVTPYRNLDARGGYEPQPDLAVTLPVGSSEVGRAVLAALARIEGRS